MEKHEDRYASVKGSRIRYWSEGESGPNVVLIHGLGGSVEEEWRYVFGSLSERYRVYGPDVPGFGLSDKPNIRYSLDFGAQFVKDFMDEVEIERAVVVGISMGGAIALQFAVRFQDRLNKLVAVDSAGLGRNVSAILKILSVPVLGNIMLKISYSNSEKLWKSSVYDYSTVKTELVEADFKLASIPGYKRAFLRALRSGCGAFGTRRRVYRPLLDGLGSIRKPALIIWGKQDPLIPVEYAYRANEKIPGSQLRVIDRCGHVPPVERPDDFVKILTDFISG
jgi:pimeloyl-ACP methyl ester carboxylesterase